MATTDADSAAVPMPSTPLVPVPHSPAMIGDQPKLQRVPPRALAEGASLLRLTLLSGTGLPLSHVLGETNPYVSLALASGGKEQQAQQSSIKYRTTTPQWSERFEFLLPPGVPLDAWRIVVQLSDRNLGRKDHEAAHAVLVVSKLAAAAASGASPSSPSSSPPSSSAALAAPLHATRTNAPIEGAVLHFSVALHTAAARDAFAAVEQSLWEFGRWHTPLAVSAAKASVQKGESKWSVALDSDSSWCALDRGDPARCVVVVHRCHTAATVRPLARACARSFSHTCCGMRACARAHARRPSLSLAVLTRTH